MERRNRLKVTIIGAGAGGLSCAAFLARAGAKVRVLERAQRTGGKAGVREEKGYRFDDGPSIIVLKAIYDDVFRALGQGDASLLGLERLDPAYRVFGAHGERFDVRADFGDTLRSLREGVSESAARELETLFGTLDRFAAELGLAYADKLYERPRDLIRAELLRSGLRIAPFEKYSKTLARFVRSPFLREFLLGFPSYSGFAPARAPASLLVLAWTIFRQGVFYPRGGISVIPRALESIALEYGARVTCGADVTEIKLDSSGSARTLVVSGERVALDEGEQVVFGGDLSLLAGRLCPEAFSAEERMRLGKRSPSFFTIQLGLASGFEGGLAHHNLFLPGSPETSYQDFFVPGSAAPERPPLYLNLPSLSDSSLAPDGRVNGFVVVSVPSHTDATKQAALAREGGYAERILDELRRVWPTFPTTAEVCHVKASVRFEDELGQCGGQIYGPDVHENGALWGLFRPVPKIAGARNLWLVGGSTQPGAGLPMAVRSGQLVAQRILRG